MSDDSVYADDGTYLGEMMEAEDGAKVLIDETGEIVAAVDEQGNALDPAGYTMADDGYGETDDLRDEVDELREWSENFDPVAMREQARAAGAAFSDQLGDEAWALDVGRQLRNLEDGSLGRALTQGEVWRLLEEVRGDHEHGLPSDLTAAVERVGITPFAPGRDIGLSETQHGEARRQYMAQLIEDGAREERGETPDDLPPRMAEDYDLNHSTGDQGHSARVSLAMDSIAGHDVEGRAYDSSHTYEED